MCTSTPTIRHKRSHSSICAILSRKLYSVITYRMATFIIEAWWDNSSVRLSHYSSVFNHQVFMLCLLIFWFWFVKLGKKHWIHWGFPVNFQTNGWRVSVFWSCLLFLERKGKSLLFCCTLFSPHFRDYFSFTFWERDIHKYDPILMEKNIWKCKWSSTYMILMSYVMFLATEKPGF